MYWYQIFAISKNEEETFHSAPSKTSIFCSTHFLCDLQKNTRNKHMFKICDVQVLFQTFFSKMYNKEKLFIAVLSPYEIVPMGIVILPRDIETLFMTIEIV